MDKRDLQGWRIICGICGRPMPVTKTPFENESIPKGWVKVPYPEGLYDPKHLLAIGSPCAYACCVSHGQRLEQVYHGLMGKKLDEAKT